MPQRRIGETLVRDRRIELLADVHGAADEQRHARGREQAGGVKHRHVAQEHGLRRAVRAERRDSARRRTALSCVTITPFGLPVVPEL